MAPSFMVNRARHEFRIKRVYDAPSSADGARFLVDRLWPRGVRKETLQAGWLKVVAPSPALREWFGHQEARWTEFCRSYRAELAASPAAWAPLLEAVRHGDVTLLYAARDRRINHAAVLRDFLTEKTKHNQPTKERH